MATDSTNVPSRALEGRDMTTISLRQFGSSEQANTLRGMAQKLGRAWSPPPPISVRDLVRCSVNVTWTNYMRTAGVRASSLCTPESLEDLIAIIQNAEGSGKHVHALGSGWSFSDCAVTPDYLLDTTHLKKPIQTVQRAVTGGDTSHIWHVQAGITIRDLYTLLNQSGLALETMGGASGQTLAGAISTGTHGGDKFLPPLADSIIAIHLVGAGGKQYWIEPYPGTTDPALLCQFVTPGIDRQNIIYDDNTFDAALVSLGTMGIIYALVLRVRDSYNLLETTATTTWQAFIQTASVQLNDPSTRFLQVMLDPYTNAASTNPCLVTTRKEVSLGSINQCQAGNVVGAGAVMLTELAAASPPGFAKLFHDLIGQLLGGEPIDAILVQAVNIVLQQIPSLRRVLVQYYFGMLAAAWPAASCGGPSWQVMDVGQRGAPSTTIGGYSIEMFFPATGDGGVLPFADFVDAAITVINSATNTFLAGYIAIRFMSSTRACLGMQQWTPTCSVEISTLPQIQGVFDLLMSILDLMYQKGAPALGTAPQFECSGCREPLCKVRSVAASIL